MAVGTLAALLSLSAGCDAVRRVRPDAETVRVVEMGAFEGGYGVEWHQRAARAYSDAHRADRVRVEVWGNQRVDDIVKPRILRGDPPELVLCHGLPFWKLIAAGKLEPFDRLLEEPAHGSAQRWRDLFIPGTLDSFTSDGHVYAVPSAFAAWACWYNARLFREHGWEVPKTWSEFDALCRQIRAAGIAPIAFQGKYPAYGWYTLITLVQRCGGVEAINRINAIEPGALTHPDVVRAARLMQAMALEHFQAGAMAMTHTESQLQFVNDKAALVFCGIWLENEQKGTTPPDFEMRAFNIPAVEGGQGNPDLFCGEGAEYIFAFRDSRNPELGQEFCRYLVSPALAPDMGRSIGVISPIRGGTPREAVSPALQSVLDMMDRAPGIFYVRLPTLLLRWRTETFDPAMAGLLSGKMTPEEFCNKLERAAQRELRNPDLIVPEFVRLDPRKLGEAP